VKTMFILVVLALSGCASTEPKIVEIPVWTPPHITMPKRPVLTSDGSGDAGSVVRKVENDLINVSEYAAELENLIDSIVNQPVPTALQKTEINK
jgi:hypothetical protein